MIPFTAEYYNSKSIAATPAAEDLLKVNDDAESNWAANDRIPQFLHWASPPDQASHAGYLNCHGIPLSSSQGFWRR